MIQGSKENDRNFYGQFISILRIQQKGGITHNIIKQTSNKFLNPKTKQTQNTQIYYLT